MNGHDEPVVQDPIEPVVTHEEEQQAAQEQEVQEEGGINVEDLPECLKGPNG